jgi:integrase
MSIHPTRAGKWEIRYRERRRNRSKTFDLKEDARSFDAEARVRRQRGEHVRRSSDTPTLRTFAADWMERRRATGLSDATLKTNALIFAKHLDPYLGGIRVGDLSPRRLDQWRRELEAAGVSIYMLNRSKTLLGQILADARRLDFVALNAARGLPTVRRRARRGRAAAPEQVEAMLASFLEDGQLGHATMISLLAYVGLRPREALDLRWEMVDRERLILPAEVTKGRMARSAEIPRPVLADIGRWRLACGGLGGLVFPRPADGRRWTKSDWDNWRKRGFVKAAGAAALLERDSTSEAWIGDFRPYDLRHTCASLMIRAHVGPADVAAQLGTSLELVFRTYAHSIEAMRGRPSTSIAEAISAARAGGNFEKAGSYETPSGPLVPGRHDPCSERVRNSFGDQARATPPDPLPIAFVTACK